MRATLCVAALVLGGLAAAPGHAAECAGQIDVIGRACPVPGGWNVTLDDGSTIFTHGRDNVAGHLGWTLPPVAPVAPACASLGEEHGVAIYARPYNRADTSATMIPEIRTMIGYANGFLRSESSSMGRTVGYRFKCSGGALTVHTVTLSTSDAATTFSSIVSDLRAAGYDDPLAKYWIWADTSSEQGGVGSIYTDSSLGPDNANMVNTTYGVTFGHELSHGGTWIMMHENGHNLGAVQNTSPNSSGGLHCNDGLDVMCYADGGSTSNYSSSVCSATRFDCNRDDYFDIAPSETEYLASRWNLGSPFNRFLAGCARASGIVTAGAPGVGIEGFTMVTRPFPGCAGARFALWSNGGALPVTGGIVDDVDVCFVTVSGDVCFSGYGYESGTVPAGTTAARVTAKLGLSVGWILNAF